jgi:hypothetical protein
LSAEGRQRTLTGALDFAEYYYKAYDWSLATNDPYLLGQVSSATCTACQRLVSRIADASQRHQVIRGGRIHITSSQVITGAFKIKSDYVVEIKLHQDIYTVQQQGQPTPSPVGRAVDDKSLVYVTWLDGEWKVAEVGESS